MHSANAQRSSHNFAHLYLISPSSAAFLMLWSGRVRSWNHALFYAPQSEHVAIFVIYFICYIYRDAASEYLKCKTVIYVFSTAGSGKWRMQQALQSQMQAPKVRPLSLCSGSDEVVASVPQLKRVKVRFTPTGPNQYPAKTIDLNGCSASWDLRGIG